MPNPYALTADKIFTGDKWLSDHAIVVENGKIKSIVPASGVTGGIEIRKFPGCTAVPSLIDLQIYGAHGKLLASYPEPDALYRLNDYCRSGGAAHCMPTVATNATDVFYKCIDAVRDYWKLGGKGVLGLHVEGPWLNPAKKGAHPEKYIYSPSIKQVEELLNYGKGIIKIITLAPEVCSNDIIRYIMSQGIVVSAGHSNATYKQAMHGFAQNIPVATHLYNAMSPLQHREPGLLGAILDHTSVRASIIPDGYHVDFAAVRIAKQVMKGRLFVITDAVTETDTGLYQHKLVGEKYESDGILSGSALTMSKAVKNLVQHCNIDLAEALRMCSLYPAQVMGLQNSLGKIEPGFDASIAILNDNFDVETIAE
ncbi:MAG: N-acetylglucosamine-6-phosphate deacetylase [Chitinophagaceae bacterium]